MLNLSHEIMMRMLEEHREIKKYNNDQKKCDDEWLKHMARRDVYIEVLGIVTQFLDQIEWNYIGEKHEICRNA